MLTKCIFQIYQKLFKAAAQHHHIDFVFLRDCHNTTIDFRIFNSPLFDSTSISYLHIINNTNVDISFSREFLDKVENLVIYSSTIRGQLEVFTKKTNIFIEDSVFMNEVNIFFMSQQIDSNSIDIR